MLTPSFASAAWAWFKKPVAASQSATDDLVRIFRVIALNVTDPHEAGSIQNPGGLTLLFHGFHCAVGGVDDEFHPVGRERHGVHGRVGEFTEAFGHVPVFLDELT